MRDPRADSALNGDSRHHTGGGGKRNLVDDGVLLVSDQANGTAGFQESLLAYHGMPIREAQRPEWKPQSEHLQWHGREVFKGEARHLLRGEVT